MTERKVSSERVSEERLREIIAGCEGVQGNLMSHIKHLSGLSTTSDRYLQRLDPANVKDMASEIIALRSSVKTEAPAVAIEVTDAALKEINKLPRHVMETTDNNGDVFVSLKRVRAALTAALKGDRH